MERWGQGRRYGQQTRTLIPSIVNQKEPMVLTGFIVAGTRAFVSLVVDAQRHRCKERT